MLWGDNQWAKNHTWIIPTLWALTGIFIMIALASARWFRALFASQETINGKTIEQNIAGANSSATSIRDIGAGASVVIGSQVPAPAILQLGKLTMLFAKMWEERPLREDLKGQHLLEVSFRSDYSRPTGVEFIRWDDSGANTGAPPITYFLRFRGIKLAAGQLTGTSKMVVNPGEAFVVAVDVFHTTVVCPDALSPTLDKHPIGVLVVRAEGKELEVALSYQDVRRQALTRYEKYPRTEVSEGLPETRLTLKSASSVQLLRSAEEMIGAIGFTVSNSHIQRRNTVSNIRATFTFSHFDEERFTVAGLFGPCRIDGSQPIMLETSVSLCQGDVRHLFLMASRDAIPMMAANRTRYYTLSHWPFDEKTERQLYEVEWSVVLDLQSDSPAESIRRRFIMQVYPAPQSGVSFGALQPV